MSTEYITAAQAQEIVVWLCADPLLDTCDNERVIRNFVKYWLASESRWVTPNTASRERVISATLRALAELSAAKVYLEAEKYSYRQARAAHRHAPSIETSQFKRQCRNDVEQAEARLERAEYAVLGSPFTRTEETA